MASNPLAGVYSGGAVTFNTQPLAQYYTQMLQHKQAKDEALSRYYQDLNKNINGAGMRTQDIEGGWNKKVSDLQNFYFQNGEKIRNPLKYGAQAQSEYFSRYRDVMDDIDRSKEAGKNEVMVREKMLDPKWREQTTDQDMEIAHNMSKSIYDPAHFKDGHTTPYGPEDFSFNAPRFDLNQQKEAINSLTQGLPRGESEHPTQKAVVDERARKVSVPMVAGYDNDTYNKIIERGANVYHSGQSAQKFFENELHNPSDLQTLNAPFKQHFGRDISSPEDVARAWAIQSVPQTIPGKDKVLSWNDPDAALYRQESLYDYKEKAKEKAAAADDATVEGFMQRMESEAKAGTQHTLTGINGNKTNTHIAKLTPQLEKIFEKNVGIHKVHPDVVQINDETGDYIPIYYKKDDKGVPIVKDNKLQLSESIPPEPVSRESVKANLANILKKSAIKQLSQQGNTPPVKKPVKDDPLGLY